MIRNMAIKTRRIMITLPAGVLKDVDWLAPLEDMTRDELILEAVKRFWKPHLEIRRQVLKAAANPGKLFGPFDTAEEMLASLKRQLKKRPYRITKAISKSTDQFTTGRYEGPEDSGKSNLAAALRAVQE